MPYYTYGMEVIKRWKPWKISGSLLAPANCVLQPRVVREFRASAFRAGNCWKLQPGHVEICSSNIYGRMFQSNCPWPIHQNVETIGNPWKHMETSNYEATICGWLIYHFLPTISGDFGGHLELRTGAVPITVDSLHHWWLPGPAMPKDTPGNAMRNEITLPRKQMENSGWEL